jgi:gliding motility-associated-like protein
LDVPPTGYVSGGGVGIPSTANGVKVVFDSFDNGCGMNPEIQIMNGLGYDECDPNVIRITNTIGGTLDFVTDDTYKTAVINYSSGSLTVTVNGQQYLTGNYNLNFIGYLGFTASTGGSTDRHSIRNVIVSADVATSDAGIDVSTCTEEAVQIGALNNPNYLYDWGTTGGLSSPTISNPSVTLTNNGTTSITETYTVTTTLASNPNSCPTQDSVVVTILPNTSSTIDASICNGSSYTVGGQSFSTVGVHQVVVSGINGCDSTIILNLTLTPTIQTNLSDSICQGSTLTFGSQTLSSAGNYTQTLQNSAGCDSIVNLTLSVNPILSSTQIQTICDGESVTFYGQLLTTAGSYNQTVQATTGCDSIVTLDLVVNPIPSPPNIVSNSPLECLGDALIMVAEQIAGATYTWSGPGNFSSNDNELSLIIDYQNTGIYAVYIYLNGCQSPDAIEVITIANSQVSDDFEVPNVITPNNDGLNEEIEFNTLFSSCIPFHFELFNRWGNRVFEQENGGEAFKGTTIGGEKLEAGIYFYKLVFDLYEKSGFIHIIR